MDLIQPIAAIRFASTLIAPPRCGACADPCESEAELCGSCEAALARVGGGALASPLGELVWAAPYEGVARELVVALKFAGRLRLARIAGARIAAALAGSPDRQPGGFEIVPVPPAPLRLRRRGFDPAELIATAVARELDLPLRRCLARHGGRRQVGRARSERLADPPRIMAGGSVPRHALVIDDVLTTGATIAACAGALRAAGSVEVRAAVFARARPTAGRDRASRRFGHEPRRG